MIPSIKKILTIPNVNRVQARQIRTLMERASSGESVWSDGSNSVSRAMVKIDAILDTHGVEYQDKGEGVHSPAFSFCNAGDTYNWTVLYIKGKGFRVGCWGDIVERGNYS